MRQEVSRRAFLKGTLALFGAGVVSRVPGVRYLGDELRQSIVVGEQGFFPTGMIHPFVGGELPIGWLPCDGRALKRSNFSRLYEVLGTAYGADPFQERFQLPDLRGRAPLLTRDAPAYCQVTFAIKD